MFTDGELLYAAIVALYLFDCCIWPGAPAFVFTRTPGGRWYARRTVLISEPLSISTAFVNPFRFTGAMLSASSPVVFDSTSAALRDGRGHWSPVALTSSTMVTRDGKSIEAENTVARSHSARAANHDATLLATAASLSPEEREALAATAMDARFDAAAAAGQADQFLRASRLLRVSCVSLSVAVFVGAPILSRLFSFAAIAIPLAAVVVLLNIITATLFFRLHREYYPADRGERWMLASIMCIASPTAMRSVDSVAADLLAEFEPATVAVALLSREESASLIRREIERDYGALPARAAALFRSKLQTLLSRRGIDLEPTLESGTWCLRCEIEYVPGHDTCSDCGGAVSQRG